MWAKNRRGKARSALKKPFSGQVANSSGVWGNDSPLGHDWAQRWFEICSPPTCLSSSLTTFWGCCACGKVLESRPRDSGLRGQVRGGLPVTGDKGIDVQIELPFLRSKEATMCCQLYQHSEPNQPVYLLIMMLILLMSPRFRRLVSEHGLPR